MAAVYRFKKARLHSESNSNIPASNNTQNKIALIQEPIVVDLEPEGPSQGTQEPNQQTKGIKIPIETPAQSGAELLREVPKLTKILKQVIIGYQKKNLALGQTPFKAINTSPLQEPVNMHERPSTSQFNRKTDLEKVKRRMMSAQNRINVLTGIV